MPAFNQRIRPKEYFGFSAAGFFCFLAGIVFSSMAFMPHWTCRVFFPVIAVGFYIFTVFFFVTHKDSLFLAAMWDSRRDLKCRPKEAIEQW